MGDREYKKVFETFIVPIAKKFQPDLVLISAGFDSATEDPLGGMKVSARGFGSLTRLLISEEIQAQGRVVMLLEGGYSTKAVANASASCIRALLGDSELTEASDEEKVHAGVQMSLSATQAKVSHIQHKLWPSVIKFKPRRSGRIKATS
jgi:histone deacetylase 4/5